MNNYVTFKMNGFNSDDYSVQVNRDLAYDYDDHDFLKQVVINNTFTEITFYLKDGKSYNQYTEEIVSELERICFNIIAYSEISTHQPIWSLDSIVDHDGNNVTAVFHERFGISEELIIKKIINPDELEKLIFLSKNNYTEQSAQYKELFWILHNPHRVIQFLGLYDFMSGLISEKKAQKHVHTYFRRNRERYPFISFVTSSKDNKTEEDIFTHLRNNIAHSKQAGVKAFIETSDSITEYHIRQILQVINDLLCDKYPKE